MSDNPKSESDAWTCNVATKEGGSQLAGNPEGFRLLKKKIDEVLETGLARCDNSACEWNELKLVAEHPWRKKPEKRPIRHFVALVVVGTVVATLMLIFGVGVAQIVSWWK